MEEYLIEFCAPTLASIKVGSLFSYAYASREELMEQIGTLNREFAPKGVAICLLRIRPERALTYVYRPAQLRQLLKRREIQSFLEGFGYCGAEPSEALARLKQRVCMGESFPHEIGVFLGYPLEDVAGFIVNRGKNCKCTGIWKVYGDEQTARRRFRQLKKCRDVYRRLWRQGRSIQQLTVAV